MDFNNKLERIDRRIKFYESQVEASTRIAESTEDPGTRTYNLENVLKANRAIGQLWRMAENLMDTQKEESEK